MFIPTKSDLVFLTKLSDMQLGEWLTNALEGYYHRNEGRFAFKPMETFMVQDYAISADLLNIYQQMSATERSLFVLSVTQVLTKLPLTDENVEAIGTLLEFAQLTNSAESIKALASRFHGLDFGVRYSMIVHSIRSSMEAHSRRERSV